MNSGPTNNIPNVVAIVPPMMRSGFGSLSAGLREREATEPDRRAGGAPAPANRCAGFGGDGRPDSAATIDDRAVDRGRPPRGDHRGHDREDHRGRDRPPRQVEPVDPVIDERSRSAARARPRSRDRQLLRRPSRRAPTTTPFATIARRTWRSVAPSAPSMPSARSRRWAMTANPAAATRPTNNRPMVSSSEDDRGDRGLVDRRASPDARRAARRPERVDLSAGRVEEDGDLGRRVGLTRSDECEFVVRFNGFSTSPTTWRVTPLATKVSPTCTSRVVAASPVIAMSPAPVGKRPATRRSVGLSVLPVRILGAEIERVEGSGDRDALVIDLLDRAEGALRGGDIRAVGAGERHHARRAFPSSGRDRVRRCTRARCRRSSPRPRRPSTPTRALAGATPAGTAATTNGRSRGAPVRRRSAAASSSPRPLLQRQAHDFASGASSDSGPAGGIV